MALGYDQNRFVESNGSIVAFDLKTTIIQYRPIHLGDSIVLGRLFLFLFYAVGTGPGGSGFLTPIIRPDPEPERDT